MLKLWNYGNLPELFVVLKAKKHPIIEDYAIINIGDDTQKPDADIMLYRYQYYDFLFMYFKGENQI